MFFSKKKPKKQEKKSKSLLILLIGGFLLTLLHLFKKDKFKNFENKIKNFSKEEKREVKELCEHKEGYLKFACDSTQLFKDYLIPHKGNSHKPKILRPRALTAIAITLLLVKIATFGYLSLSYPQGAYMSEILVNEVLRLVNLDRIAVGDKELKINPVLNQSALAKANDLIKNNYFAHTSLDGKKPWDWINRDDYAYIYVGENLAMNFTNAASVHQALMNSPSHKKNILNERYTDVGLAMATGEIDGKTTNVLVEHFATRSSAITSEPKLAVAPVEKEPVPETVQEAEETETQVLSELPVETKIVEKELLAPSLPEAPSLPSLEAIQELITDTKNLARIDSDQIKPELKLLGENNEKEIIEPEYLAMDVALDKNLKQVPSQNSGIAMPIVKTVRLVNYFFLAVIAIMSALLLINIIVRIEVQHKPVIIQTLALILFISSLVYFKFHILESGITDIFLI